MTGTHIDPRITWAVQHMQRHLDEPIRIEALAASVNLSPSRFRHLFQAEVGIGPLQYLRGLRLRRARLLIERTFLSVKEVMALVGYNDPSHFSRDFRRLHQVSPAKLRGGGTGADTDGADLSVPLMGGQQRARSPAA
jgi:AraC family transcriptional regulator, arabinose operon regulatory protein